MLKPDLPPYDRALRRLLYLIGSVMPLLLGLTWLAASPSGARLLPAGLRDTLTRPEVFTRSFTAFWLIGAGVFLLLAVRANRRKSGLFPAEGTYAVRFREDWASARSFETWWSRGDANHCLQVTLTDTELWTRFNGPFRLITAVQDFGLENRIPIKDITHVEDVGRTFRRLVVHYRNADGTERRLALGLRRRDEFLRALSDAAPVTIA